MKKILIAVALAFAASPGVAHADPSLCSGHVDHKDQADGIQAGDKYITACSEDGGQQAGNNAVVPHVGWGH